MAKQIELTVDYEKGTKKTYKMKALTGLHTMRAMRLGAKLEKIDANKDKEAALSEIDLIEELLDLITDAYNDQFTKDEMLEGIPQEKFYESLQEQLAMVASPEIQSKETKDFLEKKKN
ncbi:phage tail assembly chaperone G [Macrococcus armenti]|uniref:phage tail assembly chaperone G n=1 Tax=Macrococcus armenti TaxID=2875764 RepID=UPI001CCC55D1|nr:hypothetical protein [Macrococcus armenti]UBH12421.1 hypothetical protein LAU43_07535 [Macrococcus armenti]